jgi:L-seryl-tRNA(Ser) seleniumtransferase
MTPFRAIPSIEHLLQRDAMRDATARHGRSTVTQAAREAADDLRAILAAPGAQGPDADAAISWLESRTLVKISARTAQSLRPVINATGVIIHTNLGRAPIAASALAQARLAEGYSNLEYDLDRGARGHRHVHAERLICALTGAEAALVVNNNAAAALLALAALAGGREVLVSRGELVEIGGGFRVPEILTQSGASLREVGTTNRTRVADYAASIGDRTALILRVHPSNFRIEGFTERPSLTDLAALARQFSVPLVEDLGSGWLGLDEDVESVETLDALAGEPSVRDSLEAGADLVLFSGDKLLGGPQAGLIAGRRELIDRLRAHPLMRAIRADKITYAVLEATLALWAEAPSRRQLPIYRMLTISIDELDQRARALADRLGALATVRASVIDGHSTIGGGSAPGSALPTKLVVLTVGGFSASETESALRRGPTPVIARIQDNTVVLDVRTIGAGAASFEFDGIVSAVREAAGSR